MFKSLFKKAANNEVMVADIKGKTTKEIIEEIHETFYTEVDKLLANANIANSLDTDKQSLIDKCERLKALGFTNTKEVQEAESEISRLNKLKLDNETKKTLIEAINYFSFKYPNYKFITEESVKKICAKYNLIYGTIDKYIGTVPDVNLKHIENFKVNEDDECYQIEEFYMGGMGSRSIGKTYASFAKVNQSKIDKKTSGGLDLDMGFIWQLQGSLQNRYRTENKLSPLEIAAPIKDFDTRGMEIKDFKLSKIEIPDPVVLKPIIYKNQKCYLIITAWGDEASDELVVNQNQN